MTARKHTKAVADSFLFEAWNQAEHAYRMCEGAKAAMARQDFAGAVADLRVAQTAAERATHRIGSAIDYIEDLRREAPSIDPVSLTNEEADHG